MITVSFCCNDDYGVFLGMAHQVHFDEYELETSDTVWPPTGVKLQYRYQLECANEDQRRMLKLGRDIWRPFYGRGSGGNIFWESVLVHGVDAIGMMNYLMRLKWWHAESGETYLFDQFNAKQMIDPRAFFRSREVSTTEAK